MPNDHGWDMYSLWMRLANQHLHKGARARSLVVDFGDAFMSKETLRSEQRLTAAEVVGAKSPIGVCSSMYGTRSASEERRFL